MCFEHRIDKKTINSIRSAIEKQEQIVSEFVNQTTPDKDGWIHVCKSQVNQEITKLNTLKKSLNSLLNGKKSSVFGWCKCDHCSTMSDAKYSELAKQNSKLAARCPRPECFRRHQTRFARKVRFGLERS